MDAAPMDQIEPNHHASHAGFSGLSGLKAARCFLSGRDEAAHLAIELAGLQADDTLVDIGCGPGVAIAHAAAAGAQAVGVDPANVMLNVARAKWLRRRNVSWRRGTAEHLPVDDAWADVVWSLATVHHWVDLTKGLDEVRRVLGAGGRFVAMERLIEDPRAEGVAGHGWNEAQAALFAEICERHGLIDAQVKVHRGDTDLISVVAHRAG